MTASPAPELAETPYTAEAIRAATKAGRTYEWRVEADGAPAGGSRKHVIVFTEVDDAGAAFRSTLYEEDGSPVAGSDKTRHATWDELRKHAEFPRAALTLGDETITIPAGTFACRVYTVSGGAEVTRFWFADDLPGAPVKFTTTKDGKLVESHTLVRHTTE